MLILPRKIIKPVKTTARFANGTPFDCAYAAIFFVCVKCPKLENKKYNEQVKLAHRVYPQVANTEGFFLAKLKR